jgi:hypothetical protein
LAAGVEAECVLGRVLADARVGFFLFEPSGSRSFHWGKDKARSCPQSSPEQVQVAAPFCVTSPPFFQTTLFVSLFFSRQCAALAKNGTEPTAELRARHHCGKNWSGSSKAMEAEGTSSMAFHLLNGEAVYSGFRHGWVVPVVGTLISDDDSSQRAKLRDDARLKWIGITFLADFGHRIKCLTKVLYVEKLGGDFIRNAKANFSSALREGKGDEPDYHKARMDSALAHTFGDHKHRALFMSVDGRPGCRALIAEADGSPYIPNYSGGVYPSKDSKHWAVTEKVWNRLTSAEHLAQCRHDFDTNSNEANNKSATSFEFPKANELWAVRWCFC